MSASVATVLFVAAITPGPNNIVVMDVAARSRLTAALAPIAGIVMGTLGLVIAIHFGLEAILDRWEHGSIVLRIVGAGLLVFLAIRLVQGGWSGNAEVERNQPSPSTVGLFIAMLTLQIVNPKTWVLALTVNAAHASAVNSSILPLVGLIIVIPTVCLLIWAVAGRTLQPALARPLARRAFVIAMGAILLMFAGALAIGGN